MTTRFHHLLHLSKVTTTTTFLMEARVVTNETAVPTETTAMYHGNNFGGCGDKDFLSPVLSIATTLNPQVDSPIVS